MKHERNAYELLLSCQNFDRNSLPSFDFHLHTNWTDGENTVQEMHNAASKAGLTHILFSEHVRNTSENWFFGFAQQVRESVSNNCLALVGIETKIMDFDGNLDVTSNIMENADLVMASVHRFPGEEGIIEKNSNQFNKFSQYEDPIETEFRLANLILENPEVDILGHPFGMSYKRFNLVPSIQKIKQLIKKAAQTGTAFEVNSRYHPNLWELIDLCKKYGAVISLGSNAHSVKEVGKIVHQLQDEVKCAIN